MPLGCENRERDAQQMIFSTPLGDVCYVKFHLMPPQRFVRKLLVRWENSTGMSVLCSVLPSEGEIERQLASHSLTS